MRTALALVVSFGPAVQVCRAAEPASLAAVVVEEDRAEFQFSSPVLERVRFEPDPPRLIIDWQDANLTAAAKSFEGKGSVLKGIRIAQFSTEPSPAVRAVVEMSAYAIYSIDWDGNTMHLAMGEAAMRPRELKESASVGSRPEVPLRRKVVSRKPPVSAPPQPLSVPSEPADASKEAPPAAGPSALPPPSLGKAEPVVPPAKPKAQASIPEPAKQKAPAAASNLFMVQAGSFSDETKALALKKAVEGAVSPVEIHKVAVGGKTFFQVRVGPYEGRPAADEALAKLKGLGHAGAYVVTKK
ncbi:MAG: SPOR domain-containing protein [Elusimicrobia bacterium]|nr:SPOR domain-containing protein [Elusimicrobiota bacterium]